MIRLIFCFFILTILHAEDYTLINKKIANGEFSDALSELTASKLARDSKFFELSGLIHFKLEEYGEAAVSYQKAITQGNFSKDTYYSLAQSQYAINELDNAVKSFNKSIEQKYNEGQSLYYIATIQAIFEQHKDAILTFKKIYKDKKNPTSMRQAALYQATLSKIALIGDNVEQIEKLIIPAFEQAILIDKKSNLAKDIAAQKIQIAREHNLDPLYLQNGKTLPPTALAINLSESFKYDSNVTTTSDSPSVITAQRDSYINELSFDLNYRFVFDRAVITTPSISTINTYHTSRSEPSVFQNDSTKVSIALNNTYEHTVNEKPASFIFNIELSDRYSDIYQNHDYDLQNRSFGITIGEQFSTKNSNANITMQYSAKLNNANSDSTSGLDHSITMIYLTPIFTTSIFVASFIIDMNRTTDTNSSTNSFISSFDYLIPAFMDNYSLSLSFASTFLDPMKQRKTRGIETTLSPSANLERNITQKMSVSLGYAYTTASSKDKELYAYTKSVISFFLKYKF